MTKQSSTYHRMWRWLAPRSSRTATSAVTTALQLSDVSNSDTDLDTPKYGHSIAQSLLYIMKTSVVAKVCYHAVTYHF
jgi:hypothetical protein